MAQRGGQRNDNVIDLTNDSDSEDDGGGVALNLQSDAALAALSPESFGFEAGDLDDFSLLEDIPDVDVDVAPTIDQAACLEMILNVFPDIAINHVLGLIGDDNSRTVADCEQLIMQLLDEGFPKESDEVNRRKRKRSNTSQDDDVAEFKKGGNVNKSREYRQQA
jgi:TRIAD3 protein (E3 ubiquitin-protein ligase RNF216)